MPAARYRVNAQVVIKRREANTREPILHWESFVKHWYFAIIDCEQVIHIRRYVLIDRLSPISFSDDARFDNNPTEELHYSLTRNKVGVITLLTGVIKVYCMLIIIWARPPTKLTLRAMYHLRENHKKTERDIVIKCLATNV